MENKIYLGNPNLKAANQKTRFTKKQVEEFIKCEKNPIYFISKYLKIVTLDHGLQPFNLYTFQKEMIDMFHNNRFSICKLPRQTGEFLGSVDTLITPTKLKMLSHNTPIKSNAGLDIHEDPVKNKRYVITVDVARGTVNDYSAFVVIDATSIPYKVVAKYRNNEIKPLVFPQIIYKIATVYNQAEVLIEVNDIGGQVADTMQFDLEYDNLIMVNQRGRSGQVAGTGFSGRQSQLGLRTTKATKKIGCSNLKAMIEHDKIIVEDFELIQELSTYVLKGKDKFQAEDGSSDDLVTCLVMFAWLSNQTYFKELTDQDIRARLVDEQQDAMDQDMAPFGFIDDGVNPPEPETFKDPYGTMWSPVKYKRGL
jgi:hypothetical protein